MRLRERKAAATAAQEQQQQRLTQRGDKTEGKGRMTLMRKAGTFTDTNRKKEREAAIDRETVRGRSRKQMPCVVVAHEERSGSHSRRSRKSIIVVSSRRESESPRREPNQSRTQGQQAREGEERGKGE